MDLNQSNQWWVTASFQRVFSSATKQFLLKLKECVKIVVEQQGSLYMMTCFHAKINCAWEFITIILQIKKLTFTFNDDNPR